MIKLKRIFCLTLVLVLTALFCACSLDTSTPEGAVNQFMGAVKKYDVTSLAALMTEFPTTKEGYNLTYDLFADKDYVSLFQTVYKDLKFTVKECTENGNNATAVINIQCPDLNAAYSTALYSVAAKVFEDEKLYQIFMDENSDVTGYVPQQMIEMYKNGEIESAENEYTIQLLKKNDTWLIINDDSSRNLMTAKLFTIASNAGSALDTDE